MITGIKGIYPLSFLIYTFGHPVKYDGDLLWTVRVYSAYSKTPIHYSLSSPVLEEFKDGYKLTIDCTNDTKPEERKNIVAHVEYMLELAKVVLLDTRLDVSQQSIYVLALREFEFWQEIAEEKMLKVNNYFQNKNNQNR